MAPPELGQDKEWEEIRNRWGEGWGEVWREGWVFVSLFYVVFVFRKKGLVSKLKDNGEKLELKRGGRMTRET